MSSEPQELSTVEDIDAEIARLTKARELLADPGEREKRRILREQLAGRWVVTCWLGENQLETIKNLAGTDAWLFDPVYLQLDGWMKNDQGQWTLPRQSPSEGPGP